MVGYVENESFNLVCAMSNYFYEITINRNNDIGAKTEWDSCTYLEYAERVREKGEDYRFYLELLKYKKLRDVYSRKILSYFNVERESFAKELADYLTKQENESYIVSEYVRRVNNNDISFLLVHPENVSDFTSFEENKKIYLITAWLKNFERENDKYINLVNPVCSVVLNGRELYIGTKVFSELHCLGENGFYASMEFRSYADMLHEPELFEVDNIIDDGLEKYESINEFLDKKVENIANNTKVDLNLFPQFEETYKENSRIVDYRQRFRMSDTYRVHGDVRLNSNLTDIEITYYLENKHLFE